jgi:hypothetical protein
METLIKYGCEALTVGTTGYVAASVVGGSNADNILGSGVNVGLGIGIGSAVGSVCSDLAHDYILPHIPQSQRLLTIESGALSVVASSLGAIGTIYALDGSSAADHILPISVYAVGSMILGKYLNTNFVTPTVGSFYQGI